MQTLLIEMKTIFLFYFIGNIMNKSIDKTTKSITRNALLRRKRKKEVFFAISLRKLKKNFDYLRNNEGEWLCNGFFIPVREYYTRQHQFVMKKFLLCKIFFFIILSHLFIESFLLLMSFISVSVYHVVCFYYGKF